MAEIPDIDTSSHHRVANASDAVAFGFTQAMRFVADVFFAHRYGHRAVVLETVAAVPGMVGAMLIHLRCLRRMTDDNGWIHTLLDEAENERMHLMTFVELVRPTLLERLVVLFTQWLFYIGFFLLYLAHRRTAHRVVGYFEEEAVISYTLYLAELRKEGAPNPPAPEIARRYWNLAADATLRDVVTVIRADEAHHRDVNHALADAIAGRPGASRPISPSPAHLPHAPPSALSERLPPP